MRTITDYLAIIPIGTGSSWGRAPTREAAIKQAIKALGDWTVYYELSNIEVTVNVIDVTGYGTISWQANASGLMGNNEATGNPEAIERPIEHVKRITPTYRK